MERRKSRVSEAQWGILIEFLETNTSLARSRNYNNSANGRAKSLRLWQEVATLLNAEGSGTKKSPKQWAVYISNYKSKLKTIVAAINNDANATGGGPPRSAALSDWDTRFLALLGPGFGQAAPQVMVLPFPDEQPSPNASTEASIQTIEDVALSQDRAVVDEPTEAPILNTTEDAPTRVPSPMPRPPPLLPRQTRQRRPRTRPLAPLDEARRVLAQVELQRAAADEANARAHELLAQNVADMARHLGRLADLGERYLEYLISQRTLP